MIAAEWELMDSLRLRLASLAITTRCEAAFTQSRLLSGQPMECDSLYLMLKLTKEGENLSWTETMCEM